jgi:hypothetical protein
MSEAQKEAIRVICLRMQQSMKDVTFTLDVKAFAKKDTK